LEPKPLPREVEAPALERYPVPVERRIETDERTGAEQRQVVTVVPGNGRE
jgi:hypothetical protein